MLNFQRHNVCYEEHFYQHFLGQGHCITECAICIKKDTDILRNRLQCLKIFQITMITCNDLLEYDNCESYLTLESSQGLPFLIINNSDHICDKSLCPCFHFNPNINIINNQCFLPKHIM